jgi:hypothetical protein
MMKEIDRRCLLVCNQQGFKLLLCVSIFLYLSELMGLSFSTVFFFLYPYVYPFYFTFNVPTYLNSCVWYSPLVSLYPSWCLFSRFLSFFLFCFVSVLILAASDPSFLSLYFSSFFCLR